MNANPTPSSVRKVQLLTRPSFADLRGAKFFRCVRLVGAVGIELKATLKARKLLILLNAKNAKNIIFAQVRYTPGTRDVNGGKGSRIEFQEHWYPNRDEFTASHSSRKMRGVRAGAATGSTHGLFQRAFTTSPGRAIQAM
jgi:hypothetical protein